MKIGGIITLFYYYRDCTATKDAGGLGGAD